MADNRTGANNIDWSSYIEKAPDGIRLNTEALARKDDDTVDAAIEELISRLKLSENNLLISADEKLRQARNRMEVIAGGVILISLVLAFVYQHFLMGIGGLLLGSSFGREAKELNLFRLDLVGKSAEYVSMQRVLASLANESPSVEND